MIHEKFNGNQVRHAKCTYLLDVHFDRHAGFIYSDEPQFNDLHFKNRRAEHFYDVEK